MAMSTHWGDPLNGVEGSLRGPMASLRDLAAKDDEVRASGFRF